MFTKQQHRENIKTFRKDFSEQIIKLREFHNLSLEELAEKTDIRLARLKNIETRVNLNWGTIFQLARFYEKKVRLMFY